MLICKRPDRDAPGIICGHPLPCPYHAITLDTTKPVPTVTFPMTFSHAPVVTRKALATLKDISLAIHEESDND